MRKEPLNHFPLPRITMVANELGFGGGERIFLDLAREFSLRGFDLEIFTQNGSKLEAMLRGSDLNLAMQFQGADRRKSELYIANDFLSLLRSGFSKKIKRALICHGPWELTWKKKLYLKLLNVDTFCVSNSVAAAAHKVLWLKPKNVHTLMYGPFVSKIRLKTRNEKTARSRFQLEDAATVIGSMSRFHSVKRIYELIKLFEGRREILLLGLSTGFNTADEIATRETIESMDIPTNVRIFHNIDPDEFLDAIDVFISLSISETLGLTFLEASAKGIPTFTTAVGGPNDFFVHGLNGYFLESVSLDEISKEFFDKVHDANLISRLSRNCSLINRDRNPEIAVDQILSCLQ